MNKATVQEKELKVPFKMNLQLFSDSAQPSEADLTAQAMAVLQGGNQEPSGQAPGMEQPIMHGEGNPQNSPQNSENGGQPQVDGQGQPINQSAGTEQPGQQALSTQDQLLLGKFKSPEELMNGYANVEKAFSQKAQEAAALQQQLQAAQQQMQQMQQQIQSVVNPQQQQQQPTPEETDEQFMNMLYEKPTQTIDQRIEQAIKKLVMPQIAPIQQQYQAQQIQQAWNQARNEMSSQVPDFQQMQPMVDQILQSNPELQGHPGGPQAALNIAYQMARGQQYQDPNAILGNKDLVMQKAITPEIEREIIERYLKGVKQGNQAPTVIAGQANGAIPVTPENRPQSMDEANAVALKMMRG